MVNETNKPYTKNEISSLAKCILCMNIPIKIIILIIIFMMLILLSCTILFNFLYLDIEIEIILRSVVIIIFIGILIKVLYDFSKKNDKKIKSVSYIGHICLCCLIGECVGEIVNRTIRLSTSQSAKDIELFRSKHSLGLEKTNDEIIELIKRNCLATILFDVCFILVMIYLTIIFLVNTNENVELLKEENKCKNMEENNETP